MSDHIKALPKWFLVVALTVILALGPFWYRETQRSTAIDHRLKTLESQKIEERVAHIDSRVSRIEYQIEQNEQDRERFIQVLDKMDDNLGRLSEAVVSLKVEIKNLKNKE